MDWVSFERLRKLAYDKAGIALNAAKEPLVAARVGRRLRALGLKDERSYAEYLAADESGDELVLFLDAISTNFTSFFREPVHFDELNAYVQVRLRHSQRRFRFWSAACSSGEEPYSMAISLQRALGSSGIDWKILATDISSRMLALARSGRYTAQQLSSVAPSVRKRCFTPHRGKPEDAEEYAVTPELRRRVVFRRFNLSTPPFPMPGPLDVVLCRNVMIYFDGPVRQGLISEVERLLRPGGLLFIGHAETLSGIATGLESIRPSVYRKPGAGD
jgi:chemotaxis protein methyltransferase CheR